MRIGHGYDVHAFGDADGNGNGDGIVLGGVRIQHDRPLVAHSDGDVLIHAVCDALLGAAGLGDIGRHFPDTDSVNANRDSRIFLRSVLEKVRAAGWQLGNLDSTLVAQAPRLQPHIEAMREVLASDLEVVSHQVNVKATTTEGLGFAGRREGIAAHAVVLLIAAKG